ncbi:MAG: AlpA family transcriptional regulator [Pacificimonas sp.]
MSDCELSSCSTRLIRLPEVRRRVGLGRSTIYRRMEDGTFPRPRQLGGNVVAWTEQEIDNWIDACPVVARDT